MNVAARIVSDTLLGTYYKPVKLGGIKFRLYQPTIRDLCRMFNGASFSIHENMNYLEMITSMPEHLDEVCRTMAIAVTIKWPWLERLAYEYIRRFSTIGQLYEAVWTFGLVVRGDEIFRRCAIDRPDGTDTARVLGNNTICGQVVTFMEQLNLTYKEAFERISFPLLLLMSADKLRVSYADEDKPAVKKATGKEMLMLKKGK